MLKGAGGDPPGRKLVAVRSLGARSGSTPTGERAVSRSRSDRHVGCPGRCSMPTGSVIGELTDVPPVRLNGCIDVDFESSALTSRSTTKTAWCSNIAESPSGPPDSRTTRCPAMERISPLSVPARLTGRAQSPSL
jgi:hypothetical protein